MLDTYTVQAPGTKTAAAPCLNEKCRHGTCKNLRRIVLLVCRLCETRADYGQRLVTERTNDKGEILSVVHVRCQIRAWETGTPF